MPSVAISQPRTARSVRKALAERLVQPAYLVLVHVVHGMGVGIHRLRDRGVSEQGLDDLRAHALVEQFVREGVAQAVERELLVLEPGAL
jgi:hypothetical protein